jgi:hypothetical protein
MTETLAMDVIGMALIATVPLSIVGCAVRALLRRFAYHR